MDKTLLNFLQHLDQDQDLPASYREAWEQDLLEFATFLQGRGRKRWQDVTPGDCREFFQQPGRQDSSPRHLDQQREALQRFLAFLVKQGLIADNPLDALSLSDQGEKPSQVLSQSELQALMSGLRAAGPDYMDELLEQFYHHLGAERGLATLTLESYAHDLQDFRKFLRSLQREAWEEANLEDLQRYLSSLQSRGLSARSRARRSVGPAPVFPVSAAGRAAAVQPGGTPRLPPPALEAAPGAE